LGIFEALLHTRFPNHQLVVRNLSWSADEIGVQPRPANFADIEQHLLHERIDVVFAAFGFNESFAGEPGLAVFRTQFGRFVEGLKSKSFNGKSAARVVIVSPIANENVPGVAAADLNNERIKLYADVMRDIAKQHQVGFVDVFSDTWEALRSPGSQLTINGCHLNQPGDLVFAQSLFRGTFGAEPAAMNETLRRAVVDKDRQFFRRYRPLNTFYYTGDRNKDYGYLDFLPAWR
jgi:lysophospholipase L1-like esterase